MEGIPYTVDNEGLYPALVRRDTPEMHGTITHMSETCRAMIERVASTAVPELLPPGARLIVGEMEVPFEPAICYRSDNPPPPDWHKGLDK